MKRSHIAAAGYATDPKYAAKLFQIMNTYNLYAYDEIKEEDEMSAEDKQKLASLEKELKELRILLSDLTASRDMLKTDVQEQGRAITGVIDRLSLIEGQMVMNVPACAVPAFSAAVTAGLLDTPTGGSLDFYRVLTVLHPAGLLLSLKEG
ncbi:hypothetical protein NST99_15035 [Paenibacillus sp. FSL L8-0470]|uniref:hypothetical protein n=2 Tax=Paenibacillus TaxID=44249 RepID=UPI0030F77431